MAARELAKDKWSGAQHAILDQLPFRSWCLSSWMGWDCTRPRGHRGRHEAGIYSDAETGATSICAWWDQGTVEET